MEKYSAYIIRGRKEGIRNIIKRKKRPPTIVRIG